MYVHTVYVTEKASSELDVERGRAMTWEWSVVGWLVKGSRAGSWVRAETGGGRGGAGGKSSRLGGKSASGT